ncbi:MAG: metallophosphoesterase [Cytophagales bacterium]|nr:MAG: metallophosphoesterase [Cytophagales bacterium]
MNRILFFILIGLVFLALDWYVYQAVRTVSRNLSDDTQRIIGLVYWGFTALSIGLFLFMQLSPPDLLDRHTRTFLYAGVIIPYLSKVFALLFVLIDDIGRFFRWIISLFYEPDVQKTANDAARTDIPKTDAIPRSDFLMKTALIAGAIPLVSFSWGILSGAHDYRVRRVRLALKNLPKGFEGMRIAQLSDIHSGSFFNKTAVKGGVEMLLKEKPDMVFFTGDLVNNTADEVQDYIPIFRHVKAPLGVYSTLGNHDYGDYVQWPSQQVKQQNLRNLKEAHRLLGWNLMLDEHRIFTQDGDKIALIGIENWGAGQRWPKYGNLANAYRGTEDYPVKLLLSHDPSHWEAQVRPQFPGIDAMFAGHTHGMQFGVEIGGFKWSPSQYVYKQWAGLYRQGDQQLYVNRGFGYLGYPGRVGILPEITIFELTRG